MNNYNIKLKNWFVERTPKLIVLNMIIMFFVLMHSLGYFHPFFVVSANFVIMFSIFLSVVIVGTTSRFVFACSLLFWIVAAFFDLAGVQVWAERMGVYTFESMVLGFAIYSFETIFKK